MKNAEIIFCINFNNDYDLKCVFINTYRKYFYDNVILFILIYKFCLLFGKRYMLFN